MSLPVPLPIARRLLAVDALNIVVGSSAGLTLPPDIAASRAVARLEPIVRWLNPSHLVVALDHPAPTLRKQRFPAYKKHRASGSTEPYAVAARRTFAVLGWPCVSLAGYEADDLLGTLARHAEVDEIFLLSGDSDIRALAHDGARPVTVLELPRGADPVPTHTGADVCARYGLAAPGQLADLKALAGDKGDGVPGVPGISRAIAAELLRAHGSVEAIIAAGALPTATLAEAHVACHAERARFALSLVTLDTDAPLPDLVRRARAVVEYRRHVHQDRRAHLRVRPSTRIRRPNAA